ncbi:hemolysin [Bryobacterales bacterium F-183]|nr:hemolysin [Bryobacterales bacterium F-183]
MRLSPPVESALQRLAGLPQMRDTWHRARACNSANLYRGVLDTLNIAVEATGLSPASIPATGPLLIVANHPFGLIEGPILGDLLHTVRPDLRFLANSLLARELPDLAPHLLTVDVFGNAEQTNAATVRRALEHLKSGGALMIFPAGEVSAKRTPLERAADIDWNPMAARLAMRTGAAILPVYFDGQNSPAFQLAGMIHPRLRTLLLPHEMLARRGKSVRVTLGALVHPERFRDAISLTRYLRSRVYAMAGSARLPDVATHPTNAGAFAAEVATLIPLLSHGHFDVHLAQGSTIPEALREIGRLRELTFRQAGEGTGKPLDLDEFDPHYWHLFLWNRQSKEVAGAYRLAAGHKGRYLETLFHFPLAWKRIAPHSLELGRSFVAPAYQKSFSALLLLWRGIGEFVAQAPASRRYLFGAVSISASYTGQSRAAIAQFFGIRRSGYFPRNPFTLALGFQKPQPVPPPQDLASLDALVRQLEPDGKGLPVLLRHYQNLGGEILCWNIDPRFRNTLDGLVLVDLHRAPRQLLERYFTPQACNRMFEQS